MNIMTFNMLWFQKIKFSFVFLIMIILSSAAHAGDDCQSQNNCLCSSTGEASGSCFVAIPDSQNGGTMCANVGCSCTAVPKPLGGVTYMKSC